MVVCLSGEPLFVSRCLCAFVGVPLLVFFTNKNVHHAIRIPLLECIMNDVVLLRLQFFPIEVPYFAVCLYRRAFVDVPLLVFFTYKNVHHAISNPLSKSYTMKNVVPSNRYPDFITITCLNWIPLLEQDRFKDIIISSLDFLICADKINVYAFVIMPNHLHLIWQILGNYKREDVQRDFLKSTGQQILKVLRKERPPVQGDLMVMARDRRFQVWERNSLSIPLWSDNVMWQKLTYIHYNPVKAGLCNHPEEYKYSSASFYHNGVRKWNFLTHCSRLKCLLVRNTNKGGRT